MDLPAEQQPTLASRGSGPVAASDTPRGAVQRRRRPSGEPPALPRHLRTSGVGWLLATVVLVAGAMAVFAGGPDNGAAVWLTAVDGAVVRWLQTLPVPGLEGAARALAALSSPPVLSAVSILILITLLALRRFRHLLVWVTVATVLQVLAGILLARWAQRPRPFGVHFRAGWAAWAMPSLPMTLFSAGTVALLYSLVPEGRPRTVGKWTGAAVVALVGLGRVAVGVDAPSDVVVGAVLGVTVPLLAFRWFTPNEVFPVSYRRGRTAHLDVGGARGQAIRRALQDQLGLAVADVEPFGLAGSAGSTPLRIRLAGNPPRLLFGKLYARSHLQADRWYKLGRELLYGQLEDERPFNTVRRLVQQEDYALSLVHRAGLPSPTPYGFVELTPEREYLLVTEFLDGAVELGEAAVDEQVIDEGLRIVRTLWDAGLAHRDIKPANLLVRNGRLLLIDVAFVEARPTPWRQAVDLANMMLCLALRTEPDVVYRRARQQFSVAEITEGFAAARGLALPSQLRRMMRAQGRDLHAEFVRLLPQPPRPISIQRWSARRLALLAGAAVVLVLAGQVVAGQRLNPLPRPGDLHVRSLPCTDPERQWLLAQSVPSATQVPCLRSLPAGWAVASVAVVGGRSVLTLDHDRAGTGALVAELTATCDHGGATEIGAGRAGVRRYQRVTPAAARPTTTRWDVFASGCLTTRLRAPRGLQAELTAELDRLLGSTPRGELQRLLRQRSDGRLDLDPPDPG